MRPIVPPGEKYSDRIIRRFVSDLLNIPETPGHVKTAREHCADDDTKDPEKMDYTDEMQSSDILSEYRDDQGEDDVACPMCQENMVEASQNMLRCVCGYATAAPQRRESVTATDARPLREKLASETLPGVEEYYKKLYPQEYVNELLGTPSSFKRKKTYDYGMVTKKHY